MDKKVKKRVTLNNINEAVRKLGYRNVELVKGYGYYYWSGGIANRFKESGVYGSPYLGVWTIQQWVNDFKRRVAEVRKYGRE